MLLVTQFVHTMGKNQPELSIVFFSGATVRRKNRKKGQSREKIGNLRREAPLVGKRREALKIGRNRREAPEINRKSARSAENKEKTARSAGNK